MEARWLRGKEQVSPFFFLKSFREEFYSFIIGASVLKEGGKEQRRQGGSSLGIPPARILCGRINGEAVMKSTGEKVAVRIFINGDIMIIEPVESWTCYYTLKVEDYRRGMELPSRSNEIVKRHYHVGWEWKALLSRHLRVV